MIRGIAAIGVDKVLCSSLAQNAVHGAIAGYTGFTVGSVGLRMAMIPIPVML